MSVTLKTGEVFVARSSSPYPNFDFSVRLPGGAIEVIQFRGHMYSTEDEQIATALEVEAKASGCSWLNDVSVMKKEELDPLFALREKIRAEELEKIRNASATPTASGDGLPGAGMTTSATVASSGNVNPAAAAVDAAVKASATGKK